MKQKGMRIGGHHEWKYNTGNWSETKIAPKTWKFRYEQTKTRRGKLAPYGSGMPINSRINWLIKARQYAVKVTPNKYKLVMIGTKKQANARIGKKRWLKRRK